MDSRGFLWLKFRKGQRAYYRQKQAESISRLVRTGEYSFYKNKSFRFHMRRLYIAAPSPRSALPKLARDTEVCNRQDIAIWNETKLGWANGTRFDLVARIKRG